MSDNGKITGSVTVREIMTRYPQAERVFAKYGLTGCGGPKGPIEAISFFAKVHNVDGEQLLRELNEMAQAQTDERPVERAKPAPADIYRPFVKTAIVMALTVGCTLGAITLAAMALGGSVNTYWASITQAHGHTQIFGWVGLFVMGIAYHVVPRLKATELKGRPLATASFWIILGGLLLRAVAQPFVTNPIMGGVVVISGVLEVAAASLFAYVLLKTYLSSEQAADFFEKWVLAGVGWFWITAAATLGIDIYLAANGLVVVPAAIEVPFLHISLFGFVGTMIFGITLRTIPLFMGLRAPNKRAFNMIFWVIQPTIAAKTVVLLLDGQGVISAGPLLPLLSLIEYGAAIAFIYFLNIFRPREIQIESGADRGYEKYVLAAYAWLALAVTMTAAYAVYQGITGQEVPHAFVGAYRHALTVGFISMMIMGMSSRMIAIFGGVRLYSGRLLLIAFVLINVGNVMRVLSQPLAGMFGGVFFATMGASGFVEVTALALFGYNIWRTIDSTDNTKEEETMAQPTESAGITKDDIVADVLDRYPQTLGIFLESGFTPLKSPEARQTLAKSVTIEQATRMLSVDLADFLAALNERKAVVEASAAPETTITLPITKNHVVGELVEAYPAALDVFIEHGFVHLKDPMMRNTVAKTVSVEMACRVHGLELNNFLLELNNAVNTAQSESERIGA